jgi:hypothetical protein
LCLLSVLLPSVANAEARIALLTGNWRYSAKVGPLTPPSGVLLVGAALEAVGFTVIEVTNKDYRSTDTRHIVAVRREREGAISFVHYSDHGAADPDTKNYLIPVAHVHERQPDTLPLRRRVRSAMCESEKS